jgi:mannosyltransferase OCH1-like enzyme
MIESYSYYVRIVVGTIIQLFGNVVKAICFLHYKMAPSTRFIIPNVSPPKITSSKEKLIPRIVWQTNYTNEVVLAIYLNYLWNRFLTPTFEYRFFTDKDCLEFVEKHFPSETLDCYSRLQIGAAKADVWRVLALIKEGGVYLDIDATLLWPPEKFLLAGQKELFIQARNGTLTNYFMAAAPGNSILSAVSERIQANIAQNTLRNVFEMTGPAVLETIGNDKEVQVEESRLVCRQGVFTNKYLQYPNETGGYWAQEQIEKNIVK